MQFWVVRLLFMTMKTYITRMEYQEWHKLSNLKATHYFVAGCFEMVKRYRSQRLFLTKSFLVWVNWSTHKLAWYLNVWLGLRTLRHFSELICNFLVVFHRVIFLSSDCGSVASHHPMLIQLPSNWLSGNLLALKSWSSPQDVFTSLFSAPAHCIHT